MATTSEQMLGNLERDSMNGESAHNKTTLVSAVSWGAIFAGAAAAASLSLILMVLGAGLGLSLTSPWSETGLNAGSVGISGILWISFVAIVASGAGGYLAGRLRVKWVGIHIDEVYFRDTAHGFLAWAIATLVTAALLTSVTTTIVGGAARMGSTALTEMTGAATDLAMAPQSSASGTQQQANNLGYYLDSLFRENSNSARQSQSPATTSASDNNSTTRSIAGRILLHATQNNSLVVEDRDYLAQLISQQSELTQQQAQQRVDQTFAVIQDLQNSARETADQLREASAALSLWIVVSLLLGALSASLAATYGGRQRDS